jgi:hypothetical protein
MISAVECARKRFGLGEIIVRMLRKLEMNLTILAVVILGFAARGLAQQAETNILARNVIGLENVKPNSSGTLTVQNGAMQFDTGSTAAKIPIASIEDVVVGSETTQAGGKTGTVVKTAAIAAPFESGKTLSLLLRTNVDILTVAYRDAGGGLHFGVMALPKSQGDQERTQLLAAGAHAKAAGTEQKLNPAVPATQSQSGQKLTASAIQIEPVEAGDVQIPLEFRAAIYESLVQRVRDAGTFKQVLRSGDAAAAGVPDLVSLHATVEKFKQGSQMERETTTVLGGTKVDVSASVTARDGRTVLADTVEGNVRFRGENLGVTKDLAKHITKLLRKNFGS